MLILSCLPYSGELLYCFCNVEFGGASWYGQVGMSKHHWSFPNISSNGCSISQGDTGMGSCWVEQNTSRLSNNYDINNYFSSPWFNSFITTQDGVMPYNMWCFFFIRLRKLPNITWTVNQTWKRLILQCVSETRRILNLYKVMSYTHSTINYASNVRFFGRFSPVCIGLAIAFWIIFIFK